MIALEAYAADCRLYGFVDPGEGRLTDFLNASPELRIHDARLESLADGHIVQTPELMLARDELCAVVAGEPRGDATRRIRTHARRFVVDLGPYAITGLVHSTSASDPLGAVLRRAAWVPLTDVTISYRRGQDAVVDEVVTLLVNRNLTSLFRAVEDRFPIPHARDIADIPPMPGLLDARPEFDEEAPAPPSPGARDEGWQPRIGAAADAATAWSVEDVSPAPPPTPDGATGPRLLSRLGRKLRPAPQPSPKQSADVAPAASSSASAPIVEEVTSAHRPPATTAVARDETPVSAPPIAKPVADEAIVGPWPSQAAATPVAEEAIPAPTSAAAPVAEEAIRAPTSAAAPVAEEAIPAPTSAAVPVVAEDVIAEEVTAPPAAADATQVAEESALSSQPPAATPKIKRPSKPRKAKPAGVDVAATLTAISPAASAPGAKLAGPSQRGTTRAKPARPAAARAISRRSPARRRTRAKSQSATPPSAFCPYCALVLQPPPESSRRCPRCRQRIIVKRVDGRPVYLTEAAVLVFEAERQRITASGRMARDRERWLKLAASAGAPPERQARLAAAALSEKIVEAARTLYVSTVDRAFRAAKRDHQWETASRIRRDQAAALYRVAGSPLPPPENLVALYQEGVVAELRGIAEISRDAELVSATCCDICRADDRKILRIANELRDPRLPHEGCPKGLCRCGWDLAARDRSTMRRYLRRRPGTEMRVAPEEPAPTT